MDVQALVCTELQNPVLYGYIQSLQDLSHVENQRNACIAMLFLYIIIQCDTVPNKNYINIYLKLKLF